MVLVAVLDHGRADLRVEAEALAGSRAREPDRAPEGPAEALAWMLKSF